MITLVVLGHMIEPLVANVPAIKAVWLSIYTFHMPVFVIIAGMLTKNDLSADRIRKLLHATLVPFVAFSVLYETSITLITGTVSSYTIGLQPFWIMWFLFSLMLWRLFLPIVLALRFPLLTTVIVAVAAGYFPSIGYFLGVSRTLYFFPFFVLGHQLGQWGILRWQLTPLQRAACVGILILNIGLFAWLHELPHQWLYGSISYKLLGVTDLTAACMRLAMFAISLSTSMAVLWLAPKQQTIFTAPGGNSLYVYVWHGFLVKALEAANVVSLIGALHPVLAIGLFASLSLLLAVLLSRNAVARFTDDYILFPLGRLLLNQPKP